MTTQTLNTHSMRTQRGVTLLESLIAFLVLSLGMLALGKVQTHLRLESDISRQRSEAVRLAQEDMETLRSFSVIQATAGARSYADINSSTRTVDSTTGYRSNTQYLVSRTVGATGAPNVKQASVSVGWSDRAGAAQQVVIHSIISGSNPAYSGALNIAPRKAQAQAALTRSARIPLAAKDLGNGSSALKPVSSGGVVLVFDNLSGVVSARCAGVNPSVLTRDLGVADLTRCDATTGLLLSGHVRFSSASPPNAVQANATTLPLDVALSLTGGTYTTAPWCASEAQKTVSYLGIGGLRLDAVPATAQPASVGLASWTDTGDRFVAYHCVVYPPTAAAVWSGRATLTPSGWTIGTGPADRRVCRYSADLDGSGAVDGNIEHPASYVNVSVALTQQNFLVITGTENCPVGSPPILGGTAADAFVNLSTAQHQP